jgi:hypothetical protein
MSDEVRLWQIFVTPAALPPSAVFAKTAILLD